MVEVDPSSYEEGPPTIAPTAQMFNWVSQTWVDVPLSAQCKEAVVVADANTNGLQWTGVRHVVSGTIPNPLRTNTTGSNSLRKLVHWPASSDPADRGRAKVRVTLAAPESFIAHFDLIQVVGVDANDTDLDWNHDSALNAGDLDQFIRDFDAVLPANRHDVELPRELYAMDINADALLDCADVKAFAAKLTSAGHVSADQAHLIMHTLTQTLQLPSACE